MLQELSTVKKELVEATKRMEDLDAKLDLTSKAAHHEFIIDLYKKLTGIHIAVDDEELVHLKLGRNHMVIKEDEEGFIFDPVEVISTDLSEQIKIKKDNIADFIKFLGSQQ